MKIRKAIKWQNNMVMVFGGDGEQVIELQGEYSEVLKAAVLVLTDDKTIFQHGVWNQHLKDVTRDEW